MTDHWGHCLGQYQVLGVSDGGLTFKGSFGLSDGWGTRITLLNLPVPCLSWSRGTSRYSGGISSWSDMKAVPGTTSSLWHSMIP
jgi:hypothetical protein